MLAKKLAIALAIELNDRLVSQECVADSNSFYILFEAVLEIPELKNDENIIQCIKVIEEKIKD